MNTVLTRFRFYARQVGLFVSCVAVSLLVSYLVDRVVSSSSLSRVLNGAVNIVTLALFWMGLEWLTDGQTSYRKYLASHGGELTPPSRFWATTGQAIVCIVAAAAIGVVTHLASGAPAGSSWRGAATVAWPVIVGATLIYLLIARDWRRELASSSNAA